MNFKMLNARMMKFQVYADLELGKDDNVEEIISWLTSCEGEWDMVMGPTFYRDSRGDQIIFEKTLLMFSFEKINDATMFRLRWG